MPSKAENFLLDKFNWDTSHPDYSTASFRKDEVLAAMKEIASIPYDEGFKDVMIEEFSYKTQFIDNLFNNE